CYLFIASKMVKIDNDPVMSAAAAANSNRGIRRTVGGVRLTALPDCRQIKHRLLPPSNTGGSQHESPTLQSGRAADPCLCLRQHLSNGGTRCDYRELYCGRSQWRRTGSLSLELHRER